MKSLFAVLAGTVLATAALGQPLQEIPPLPDPKTDPPVVTPGKTDREPPSDAIVLFDGTDLSQWKSARDGGEPKWRVQDGYVEVVPKTGSIVTTQAFGDCQLHIEWASPAVVEGEGQGRGNSGVFLMGRYEIQVLDSYDNKTYAHGQAAAIYKQYAPLVNASRKPGAWQSYDVVFHAPRFDADGRVVDRARLTVFHNGVLVQNGAELLGDTPNDRPALYIAHPPKAPLSLQNHGDTVRYRNIWIRPL
jgi:hypothetical protein